MKKFTIILVSLAFLISCQKPTAIDIAKENIKGNWEVEQAKTQTSDWTEVDNTFITINENQISGVWNGDYKLLCSKVISIPTGTDGTTDVLIEWIGNDKMKWDFRDGSFMIVQRI
jgi:hypothetical protein